MPSAGVLPPAYPAPFPTNVKSLRFYATGAGTANFGDNELSFERPDPKNPAEPEQGWSQGIRITAVAADVEYSFDGTNVHGIVLAGTSSDYWERHEGGIAVRGVGSTFHVEAW